MPITAVEETEKVEINEDEKDKLLLDSLEIKGYRCFEHLTIEKLGRVNLIVGKNNVGKTALLEALWIYAQRGSFRVLFDLLYSRDEVPVYIEKAAPLQITDIRFQKEDLMSEAGNLFYGRPKLNAESKELIFVGSKKSSLSVNTTRMVSKDGKTTSDFLVFENVWRDIPTGLILISTVKENNKNQRAELYSFERLKSLMLEFPPELIPSGFVKARVLDNDALVRLWDEALKDGLEEKALEFLQIIESKIEYINFVGTSKGSGARYPIASNGNSSKRVTLKSFGEGMTRLLGISLALVQCRNGILLIDEIESGLHYSVLPDVWKLIFKTAEELNIQVFATTHSYDCIEAFSQAAIDDENSDGMLIRLARKDGQIKAFTFDEQQLETITKEQIEVR